MSLDLPQPVAAYFAADAANAAEMGRCFTENAVVVDERHTYAGRAAICRWKTETAGKFSYVSEPFAVAEDGGNIVVTSRVTGNFPGSPLDLRYSFLLEGSAIARLEITA